MTNTLLSIDVKAEIRKLTLKRFRTPGEYAVELVRHAAARRPGRVELTVKRNRFSLFHDGEHLPEEALEDLMTLFNPSLQDQTRHRALVRIEEGPHQGLLAAFALSRARVMLRGQFGDRFLEVRFRGAGAPRVYETGRQPGMTIAVWSGNRRVRSERNSLKTACAFSELPIFLNRVPIARGLAVSDSLIAAKIQNRRLQGIVGIPRSSDLVRITRLVHGIVSEEIVRPPKNGLVFQALVNEQNDDLLSTTHTVRRAARSLYLEMAEGFSKLTSADMDRAGILLMDRFSHTHEKELVDEVPLFALVGDQRIGFSKVRQELLSNGLYAIDDSEAEGRYDMVDRRVLRLSSEGRQFLEEELNVVLRAPPLRRSGIWAPKLLLRDICWKIVSWFWKTPGPPAVFETLLASEQQFVALVRDELGSGRFVLSGFAPQEIEVQLCENQSRRSVVRKEKHGLRVCISRSHPDICQMIRRVAETPALIYPAMVFLFEGKNGYRDKGTQ